MNKDELKERIDYANETHKNRIDSLKKNYLDSLDLFWNGDIIVIDKIGKAEVIEAFCNDRGDIFYKCKAGTHFYSISEEVIL